MQSLQDESVLNMFILGHLMNNRSENLKQIQQGIFGKRSFWFDSAVKESCKFENVKQLPKPTKTKINNHFCLLFGELRSKENQVHKANENSYYLLKREHFK